MPLKGAASLRWQTGGNLKQCGYRPRLLPSCAARSHQSPQPQDWVLTPATALDMVTFPKGWGAQKADSSLSPVFNLLCDLKIAGL